LNLYQFGIKSDSAYPKTVKTIYSACHKTLIKLIKAERQRAGIRQAALAKQMKKQQNWISRLEKGDRRIDVCQFLQLADLIGFDPIEALRTIEQARNNRRNRH
jgi:transcriptional regulator with XRE-family HTH domain